MKVAVSSRHPAVSHQCQSAGGDSVDVCADSCTFLPSAADASIRDSEIHHEWMLCVCVCMCCAHTRLWASERWGQVWGGACLRLHNGSAKRTWLWEAERLLQLPLSLLGGVREPCFIDARRLVLLCAFYRLSEAECHHTAVGERVWSPAVVGCVVMDIAALQGYSSSHYSPHSQVGCFCKHVILTSSVLQSLQVQAGALLVSPVTCWIILCLFLVICMLHNPAHTLDMFIMATNK